MEVATFAEIQPEFMERVARMVWANVATIDRRDRVRSRIMHPVWEDTNGWVTTRPGTLKLKHLARNPYVSVAYVADVAKPVYVDCHAEWVEDRDTRWHAWEYMRSLPPPLGFDPGTLFVNADDPGFGLLWLTPWRVELANFPAGPSLVWRQL